MAPNPRTTARLRRAGIFNVEGSADRPTEALEWEVPSLVTLHDDGLAWALSDIPGPSGRGHFDLMAPSVRHLADLALETVRSHPADRVLTEFAALHGASEERYLRFARRWGVFGVCKHWLPSAHSRTGPVPLLPRPHDYPCKPTLLGHFKRDDGRRMVWGWESLAFWRMYVRKARAILSVGAALVQGERGEEEDWRDALFAHRDPYEPSVVRRFVKDADANERISPKDLESPTDASVRADRLSASRTRLRNRMVRPILLARALESWLACGGTGITVLPDPKRLRLGFGGGGLASHLGMQLVLACCSVRALVACDSCGMTYIPSRAPRADQRKFCAACGKAASWRESKRRARMRGRADKENRADSKSAPDKGKSRTRGEGRKR